MGKNLEKFFKKSKIDESAVSMVLGAAVVVVVGVLVFNYFNRLNREGPQKNLAKQEEVSEKGEGVAPTPTEAKAGFPSRYTVKAGDYLWSIAEKYYKSGYNWVDIAKANNLTNPDVLYAGTVLVLPKVEVKKGDINGPGISTAGPQAITGSTYTVVHGDILWDIAVRACGDGYKWTKIAEDNKLANPDIIHSGNILKISCK